MLIVCDLFCFPNYYRPQAFLLKDDPDLCFEAASRTTGNSVMGGTRGSIIVQAIVAKLPGLKGKISFSGPKKIHGFGLNVNLN